MIDRARGGSPALRAGTRGAILAGFCAIAAACSTTSAEYFARMDAKGRGLAARQRWEETLRVSATALANCDKTDWCRKDVRFQGLFHSTIGEAHEHLGRRDQAIHHYQIAFYAYPLFFTENYFRLLKETGQYRLLRHEIDVKLASNEASYRSAMAYWLPMEPSACHGRSVAGNYNWRLRPAAGGKGLSGKVAVSQSGCAVTADFASEVGATGARPLRLRGDVGTGTAIVLYGMPCMISDRGKLVLQKAGFTVNADRTETVAGCPPGSYVIDFAKD